MTRSGASACADTDLRDSMPRRRGVSFPIEPSRASCDLMPAALHDSLQEATSQPAHVHSHSHSASRDRGNAGEPG